MKKWFERLKTLLFGKAKPVALGAQEIPAARTIWEPSCNPNYNLWIEQMGLVPLAASLPATTWADSAYEGGEDYTSTPNFAVDIHQWSK